MDELIATLLLLALSVIVGWAILHPFLRKEDESIKKHFGEKE